MLRNLIGRQFGRLTVARHLPHIPGKKHVWRCRCECGGSIDVRADRLLTTPDCGCSIITHAAHVTDVHCPFCAAQFTEAQLAALLCAVKKYHAGPVWRESQTREAGRKGGKA